MSETLDVQVALPSEQSQLRRFRAYAAGAGVWTVVMLLLPAPLQAPWYVLLVIATVVAAVPQIRVLPSEIQRPILLVVIAAGCSLTAAVMRAISAGVTGSDNPFPSPAEPFVFLSYIFFISAILYIVRRRNPKIGLDPILDASVGTIAVALLVITLVLVPYIEMPTTSVAAAGLNIAYTCFALLQVAVAILALVTGSESTTSNRFLAAGLVATFTLDVTALLVISGRAPVSVQNMVLGAPPILGALGILHPSVRQLTTRPTGEDVWRRLSMRRIGVLALALLAPPTLMLIAVLRDDIRGWTILPAAASIALTPLVVVRLGRLVRQNEELAALEAALRVIGEKLVGAEDSEQVVHIVADGAREVLGRHGISATVVLDTGHQHGWSLGDDTLQSVLDSMQRRTHLHDHPTVETVQMDHVEGGPWVTVAMVAARDGLSSALVVESLTALRDIEVNAISSLSRECSIALRAVEQTELQVRQRSEERFGALIENSSDIVAVLDHAQRTTYVSPVAVRLLGYDRDHLLQLDASTLIHPADLDAGLDLMKNIRRGVVETVELRLRHRDGSHHWFEVAGVDLSDDPNIGGLLLNLREISDRKKAEEQLVLSEARFKALVQNSTDMVVVLDPAGNVRYASPSVGQVLGVPVESLLGEPIDRAFVDSNVRWDEQLQGDRPSDGRPDLLEFTFRRSDEDHRTIETSIRDLRSEPAVGGFVLNARDVTDRKTMEKRLRYQATHDDLTGLINRSHVVEDLDSILGRNRGNTTVAVITLGLDDFKDVNDSLGHAFGDRLLIAVAERLKGLLSFGDIAARVGGDQFVLVVERSHGESHVAELAERLLNAVAMPFNISGRELTITASAGIVFDHDRSSTGEILLRNADTAMYRAKAEGKRRVVLFEPHMHAASYDRLELRADLARAIESDQFIAHYQPIMDIHSHRIVGAEALIRWNHPRRGMVGPNLFIPLAEETGMIGALGEWILKRACTDLAGWRRLYGEEVLDLRISVNLSAHQLRDDYIVGTVEQILTQAGLPADRLVLEVTESTLITETERTQRTMAQLRELGAELAVDDFGTGYSSLGYIQQFDFDVLKIDKSFVDGLDTDTNRRIVTAVLDLAEQLKVRTIAEGIETAEQAQVLRELGCNLGQGYHYSRPVTEASFRDLLVDGLQTSTLPDEGIHAKLR